MATKGSIMRTKKELLEMVGRQGALDLYHIESRPMWLILDGYHLITGDEAWQLRPSDFLFKEFLKIEAGKQFEFYGARRPAYGDLYFLKPHNVI